MNRAVLMGIIPLLAFSGVTTAEVLPDPTRPIHATNSVARSFTGGLKLNSILMANTRKLAVINGTPIQEGQEVNGILVKSVRARGVEINYQGRNQTLSLVPQVRGAVEKAR